MNSPLIAPGSRELFVDATGGRWRVLEGTTPPTHPAKAPLLLLHGGGYDAAGISWYRLIEPLSADRRVIAPDLPGCGGTSGVPLVGSPDLIADQLVDLLDALGVDRVVVCGVSMGGDIALELALNRPDRVAGLVGIAPGGLIQRSGGLLRQLALWLSCRVNDRGLALIARLSRHLAPGMVVRLVERPTSLPAEVIQGFIDESQRPDAGVAYGVYNKATIGQWGMLRYKGEAVAGLTAPTLLFHGLEDHVVPIEGSRTAAAVMPNAHLIEVPDCGHWAQLDCHDRFLAELRLFLHNLDAAAPDPADD